jgi:hypothetical protein
LVRHRRRSEQIRWPQLHLYNHNPADSASLLNNAIKALARDYQGRLWMGAITGERGAAK